MPGARAGVRERREGGQEESRTDGGSFQFSTTDEAIVAYTDSMMPWIVMIALVGCQEAISTPTS